MGDVGWMRLDDWRVHEKTVTNKACGEFFFLCPNGTVQLTSTPNPCVWVSQPLPTLVVRSALSQVLTHFLTEVGTSLPTSDPVSSWRWVTRNLISPYTRYITQLENEFTPNYYLAKATNYLTASEDESGCDYSHHVIRFCTDPGQDRSKCDQLAHIARAYGVVPDIECVSPSEGHGTKSSQGHETNESQGQESKESSQGGGAMRSDSCAQMLSRGEADLMSVRTDRYADALRSNSHLRPILYQMGEQRRYAVAVTKKSSHITSFAQLRNKRACFGMVNDLGWNAALYQLLRENLLPRVCPYEEAMKQYFGAICAIYSPNSSVIRQCDGNAEEGRSMAYEQKEVMECLSEGGGDVVFLDLKNVNVKRDHEWYFRKNAYALSTLCPPGSLHAPAYRNDVNASCYLLWSSQGQLLVPDSMSEERAREITNTMSQIGAYFGETVKTLGTPAESLKLFAPGRDGVEDVLFQDDTRSFSTQDLMYTSSGAGRGDKTLSRNYEHVLPLYATCDPSQNLIAPSKGSVTSPAMVLTIALLSFLWS
uniref:Transferrin n=1 Tax=Cacopsylla melanoneura TaxID=428564 RepID=A0A8D8SK93_9HEMI